MSSPCPVPNLYGQGVSLCTALRPKPVRLPMEQVSVLLTKRSSADELKKDEMDGAWGIYGREKRCVKDFGGDV